MLDIPILADVNLFWLHGKMRLREMRGEAIAAGRRRRKLKKNAEEYWALHWMAERDNQARDEAIEAEKQARERQEKIARENSVVLERLQRGNAREELLLEIGVINRELSILKCLEPFDIAPVAHLSHLSCKRSIKRAGVKSERVCAQISSESSSTLIAVPALQSVEFRRKHLRTKMFVFCRFSFLDKKEYFESLHQWGWGEASILTFMKNNKDELRTLKEKLLSRKRHALALVRKLSKADDLCAVTAGRIDLEPSDG